VRLSGVTVPRELLERVRAIAGDVRGEVSRAVEVALADWVERRTSKKHDPGGDETTGAQESNRQPED
jgi:post-segregation antitoxin (ccd killing protein)